MIGIEHKPTEYRDFGTHTSNVEIGFTRYCDTIPELHQSPISFKRYLRITKPQLTKLLEPKEMCGYTDVSDFSEQMESCSNMEPQKYSDESESDVYSNNATMNLPYTISRHVHDYLRPTISSSHQDHLVTYSLDDRNGTTISEKITLNDNTEVTETLYPITDNSAFIEYDDCKEPIPADMCKMRWMELSSVESNVDTLEDAESMCYSEKIVEPTESQCVTIVDEPEEGSITEKVSTPNIENIEEMKSDIQLEAVEDKPEAPHQPKYSKCFLRLVRALQPDLYEYIEDLPEVKQIIKANNRSLGTTVRPLRKSRSVAKTEREHLQSEPTGGSTPRKQHSVVTIRPSLQRCGHCARSTRITSTSKSVVPNPKSRLYQVKKRALSTQ
ncbi:unnamed protein product [Rodentolepis nana]|uniref:Meiotic kinetochore factor n=1 Tax=Rodentolepis nana TaxID=102285 RepID=A0A0R3TAY2_RODNA|nr:unnamed protein product [Rodentolepis nana]